MMPGPRRGARAARVLGPLCLLLVLAADSSLAQVERPAAQRPAAQRPAVQQPPPGEPAQRRRPEARPVESPPARPPAGREARQTRDRVLRDAQSLARSKNCEEALKLLDTLEEGGAGDPAAVKLRGDCLRKLRRFEEAQQIYRKEADALTTRGADPTPMLVELERTTRESGDSQKAFAICLEIHRTGAVEAWVRDEMEALIQADSLGENSVGALREEIARRPQDPDLRSLLIDAFLFLGRDAEALHEAIALDRARTARGTLILEHLHLLNEKRLGAPAIAAADAALAEGLTGEDAQEALYLKAAAQRRMGDLRQAVETYDEAVKADPDGSLAHLALRDRADLLVRDLHDLEAGAAAQEDLIASLEKARPADRGRLLGQALVDLAGTRLRMGRYEEAEAVCRRVEEEAKDPSSKEDAAFLQAEILFYAAKIDDARNAYERVAREFAGGNRVNDSLDRLLLLTRAGDAGPLALAALGQIAYQRRFGDPTRALSICLEAGRQCGGCPAQEDFLREESLLLLDVNRIDEAAVTADTLASRFPKASSPPSVLRAVADRMRERDGKSDTVMHRYEDLLVRFPNSHDAFEVRALLEKLRRPGETVEPGSEVP